jgi:hypothetical protein
MAPKSPTPRQDFRLRQQLNVHETLVEVIKFGVRLGRGTIPEKEGPDEQVDLVHARVVVHGGFDVRHPEAVITDVAPVRRGGCRILKLETTDGHKNVRTTSFGEGERKGVMGRVVLRGRELESVE